MELDLHRQRRNLIGVSIALLVFQLAGGEVREVSFLSGGVSLSNPEVIIQISYLGLAYLLWRYWLYVKDKHSELQKLVNDTLLGNPAYREFVDACVDNFKEESNVAYMEAFHEYAVEDGEEDFTPIPVESEVKGFVFFRKLHLRVDNSRGDFNLDHEVYSVPKLMYEFVKVTTWIKIISTDKTFSDLYVPYLLTLSAFGALLWRTTFA